MVNLYPFLALDKPPKEGIMVIEGWIYDYALEEAVDMYRRGNYSKIICTGLPIETGSFLKEFETYPEMTAARLHKLGIPEDQIIVAITDDVTKDRTYSAAVAMREAIMSYNIDGKSLHLITIGAHGRRSLMLFQKALGKNYYIGVTCIEKSTYNASNWYTCSEGVGYVIDEFISYLYAKFFFHPKP